MKCRACNNDIPKSILVDGVRRNLQNRKFCLACSPFGCHNTKKEIDAYDTVGEKLKKCIKCGRILPIDYFYRKGENEQSYCKVCYNKYCMIRWNKIKIKAIAYKGGACEACGREGLHPVEFDFHHVGEKSDMWNTLRLKAWDKIVFELDKCQLLCCGCHGKAHLNPDNWGMV